MIYICSIIDNPDDIEKFNMLFNKYKNLVYHIAYKILDNKEDAEDALQETFLKLEKNFSKIEDIYCSKTKNFLVIISRSCSYDILRKNKNEDAVSYEDNADILIAPSVLDEIIKEEGYKKMLGIIENLNDTYKDVLKLKMIYGFTNGEIAELLGITKRSVEMRIYRGKAIILKDLTKEGYYAER